MEKRSDLSVRKKSDDHPSSAISKKKQKSEKNKTYKRIVKNIEALRLPVLEGNWCRAVVPRENTTYRKHDTYYYPPCPFPPRLRSSKDVMKYLNKEDNNPHSYTEEHFDFTARLLMEGEPYDEIITCLKDCTCEKCEEKMDDKENQILHCQNPENETDLRQEGGSSGRPDKDAQVKIPILGDDSIIEGNQTSSTSKSSPDNFVSNGALKSVVKRTSNNTRKSFKNNSVLKSVLIPFISNLGRGRPLKTKHLKVLKSYNEENEENEPDGSRF